MIRTITIDPDVVRLYACDVAGIFESAIWSSKRQPHPWLLKPVESDLDWWPSMSACAKAIGVSPATVTNSIRQRYKANGHQLVLSYHKSKAEWLAARSGTCARS